MTQHYDRTSFANPFIVSAPEITFARLVETVRGCRLSTTRKRDLVSAVNRYLHVTGLHAASASVCVSDIRETLEKIEPAKFHLSPKSWSNLKSNLLAAIELAKIGPVLKTSKVQLSETWAALLREINDRRTREGLSRFMRFCSLNEIEPAHVDGIVLDAFEAALSSSSFARHVQAIKRDVATLWNRLCDRLPDRKLRSLVVLSRRAKPKRVSLESLPCSFAADLRAHLDWAALIDPFSEEARRRPLAPRSLRLREQYVLSAVTALVKSGTDPQSIRSLADLIIPVSFKAILRQRLENPNPRSAAYNEKSSEGSHCYRRGMGAPRSGCHH